MELTTLTLRRTPSRRDELVERFCSLGILEASGALASQILIPEDEPDTIVVTAAWVDIDAYTTWQNHSRKCRPGRKIECLVALTLDNPNTLTVDGPEIRIKPAAPRRRC